MLQYKTKVSLFKSTMKNSTLTSHSHTQRPVCPRFPNQEPEVKSNVVAALPQHTNNKIQSSSQCSTEPNNHYHSADRKALQADHSIHHSPHSRQHEQVHNTNIALHVQESAPIKQLRAVVNEASPLASAMVEQPIIQAVISSIVTFDGNKSKSVSLTASVENAAHISGQNIIYIASPKMVGSSLTSACRLRDHVPHIKWKDLKDELLRQYSIQAFACLQQSSDELLEMYLHCASEFLSKCIKQWTCLKSQQKV